ncbi:hypothetical protein M1I95_16835 [Rossellomorea marisflavi]|uniref:hypothetical protein n=1 Tax=Rossellomorea marisflavi TaxID=189381 RepID=UPI0027A0CEB9|nr:hypothetical protein [Rossellomorea marisflavi]UTE71915.1 hypothetical protein M1I95_16835 [Rossellomorea marisflavi]
MRFLLLLSVMLVAVGCSMSPSEVQTKVEWADIVRWNGHKYLLDQDFGEARADEKLGEVSFSLVGSEEEDNPTYQLKDGEATFASPGSAIQSVAGVPVEKAILVEDNVYTTREE